MWIEGKQTEILLLGFEITDEPLNRPHSPKVARLGDRAFQAFREGDGVKAERLFREVIELAPDAPEWKQNLAGALQMQGREAEATALLDENIRQHPDYFFSKTELAFRAIRRRDYAEATEILNGLLHTSRLHCTQFRTIVVAFMELYWRQNDPGRPACGTTSGPDTIPTTKR
jgi:predicted Zn-dependent protease